MALRTEAQWKVFLTSATITDDAVLSNYAKSFSDNALTELSLEGLDKETLTELGITTIGHRLSILQCARNRVRQQTTTTPLAKATVTAKLSELTHEMTQPQFRKFLQDWLVYKQITQLSPAMVAGHLYNACDEAVQTSLINTYPDFNTMDEQTALDTIETVVTIRVNPAVHRKAFGEMRQGDKETIQTFVVRLRSSASDCAFECPNCEHDLSTVNIKDQLIRGLNNTTLQAEILAKADQLKTLDDVIKYAEASETALRDQSSLANNANSDHVYGLSHRKKQGGNYRRNNNDHSKKSSSRLCKGCGTSNHGPNRAADCPAWGKDCFDCGKPNHFASVCEGKDATMG